MLHLVLYHTVEGDSPTLRSLSFLVSVPPPMKPADRQVESWRCRLLQQLGVRCKGDLHKVSTIKFLNFLSLHLCSLLFSLSFLQQQLCGFLDIHTTSKKSLQSSCSRPCCTFLRMGVTISTLVAGCRHGCSKIWSHSWLVMGHAVAQLVEALR